MGKTRAQLNRAVRQEALRDQLESQGHVQYVVENIQKIEYLSSNLEEEPNARDRIAALKVASELRLKLIDKYIPALKSVELEGDFEVRKPVAISFVPASDDVDEEDRASHTDT